MAIKTISQFEAAVPADNDYILFEQNGEGKHTTIGDAVNTCSLSYEEIMASTGLPDSIDLSGKVASASALRREIERLSLPIRSIVANGSMLPSDFGNGIFFSNTGGDGVGFPYGYASIITIVFGGSSRGFQICSSYQGAIKYRANTTENSWTAWKTITLS